jgi:hypothetical protein
VCECSEIAGSPQSDVYDNIKYLWRIFLDYPNMPKQRGESGAVMPGGQNFSQKAQKGPGKNKVGRKNL